MADFSYDKKGPGTGCGWHSSETILDARAPESRQGHDSPRQREPAPSKPHSTPSTTTTNTTQGEKAKPKRGLRQERRSSVSRSRGRRGVKVVSRIFRWRNRVVEPQPDHDHHKPNDREHVEAVVEPLLGRSDGCVEACARWCQELALGRLAITSFCRAATPERSENFREINRARTTKSAQGIRPT